MSLEKQKFIQLLIIKQEECLSPDPETCDVCHMLNILIDEVNNG